MKKTISLLLALCCLFAVLTGCGGSKKTMEPRATCSQTPTLPTASASWTTP